MSLLTLAPYPLVWSDGAGAGRCRMPGAVSDQVLAGRRRGQGSESSQTRQMRPSAVPTDPYLDAIRRAVNPKGSRIRQALTGLRRLQGPGDARKSAAALHAAVNATRPQVLLRTLQGKSIPLAAP